MILGWELIKSVIISYVDYNYLLYTTYRICIFNACCLYQFRHWNYLMVFFILSLDLKQNTDCLNATMFTESYVSPKRWLHWTVKVCLTKPKIWRNITYVTILYISRNLNIQCFISNQVICYFKLIQE